MTQADLLQIARSTLLEDVLPHLTGDARFKALMIANAMAIAARAADAVVPDLPDAAGICAAIRAGRHDDDAVLAAMLLADVKARCRISSKS